MRHQPMALAFVAALFAAAAVTLRPGAGGVDWASILVGSALTAAMTGIAATIVQFLSSRAFAGIAVVAGILVALAVALLLRAAEYIGLEPLPAATIFVWGAAAIVALFVSRAAGVKLPPFRWPQK